ncbi:unnamed protein product [Blepharisma stoltei]|uniref:Kelch motif family protein n=1 Tax=Blepharisma stoltei TaxID=1481888 RepID=A0AAU9ILS1_9CILI|nr:unnamed protein product [Blepharisma stoltei]
MMKLKQKDNLEERSIIYDYYESNYLYFLKEENYHKLIYIFDIENYTTRSKYFRASKYLNCSASAVRMPNNELFLYGSEVLKGRNWTVSGSACIYDISSCSVKKVLPNGKPCFETGGIYYQSSVYFFGGSDPTQMLNLAVKFDLTKNRWFSLCALPTATMKCSCAIFKQYILIIGFTPSDLILYDIDINSYSSILHFDQWPPKSKFLINANEIIYIFEIDGKILESEYENIYVWKQIGNSDFNRSSPKDYLIYENTVFIVALQINCSLYFSFNLDEKKLRKIKLSLVD